VDLSVTSSVLPGGVILVAVGGEIDVYTAPRLREALREAIQGGARRLIVDFNAVDFLDSTGLGVLVGGLKLLRANDGELVLVCAVERILKIFRITGLTKVFLIAPDVSTAREWFAEGGVLDVPPEPDPDSVGWRWVPTRIYLSDERDHEAVEDAVRAVVAAFGLEIVHADQPEVGSWYRNFIIRFTRAWERTTKEEQFVKLSRALDIQLLHKHQAEVDATRGAAVAGLIKSLEGTPRALVLVGSVLLVKVDGAMVVRNLTPMELAHWERNPALFRDPAAALQELQRATDRDPLSGMTSPQPLLDS
jgi:anti-sigma B factor antagonist